MQILARQQIFAARRHIQAADQIHQRRLAGAGRPHNGEVIAFLDLQVDILQNTDGFPALRIVLADILHFYQHGLSSTDRQHTHTAFDSLY